MSTKPQIELFLENESGTQQVAYPFVESDHVSLSNGMDIDTMIRQDVSMPTVAHEDLSFKVGVGDQDVSSAIVDSSVAEMTIKGKTYQNILPEPSTHVLTNNKEMFKVNEGLDPNVEIVDGVSKSAILSGQTLVNWCTYSTKLVTLSRDYRMFNLISPNRTPLQQNKDYLLIIDILTLKTPVTSLGLRLQIGDSYVTVGTKTGLTKYKFNTSDKQNLNSNNLRLYITAEDAADESFQCSFKDVMIIEYQEGMENWDIPYFEGIQSVKMPVLTTTGKNLFDESQAPEQLIWGDNVKKANVKENTTYVYSSSPYTGYVSIKFYDNNDNEIKQGISINSGTSFTTPPNTSYLKTHTDNDSLVQIEEGSAATPYEPYKTNILSTPSDLELRGIGDVKDTLDLTTGEVTKRIEEIVLDGGDDEEWITTTGGSVTHQRFVLKRGNRIKPISNVNENLFLCDKFNTVNSIKGENSKEMCLMEEFDEWYLSIVIDNTKLNSLTVNGFKSWLQSNNVKMQYVVESESIKTVDLSSSGNWEKVVLDGSEDGWFLTSNASQTTVRFRMNLNPQSYGIETGFCDKFVVAGNTSSSMETESIMLGDTITIRIKKDKAETLNEFKQWLSQNPVTVWYQTTTHQDSTQVKQPIFFKDGHIIQSSGADNSLIPTLDYQAKTSNSYVMDLMKTNTHYTMKAKSASGTFTIDGTSYGAGTNGTFTTPSSMTNKFLVMSNKANTEVMILEGDVTSKTIPYFKGIKSAFEDESQIEVLSTGKNLWDEECEKDVWINGEDGEIFSKSGSFVSSLIPIKKGKTYYRDVPEMYYNTYEYDKNGNFIRRIGTIPFTASVDGYFRFCWISTDITPTYVIESSISTAYEPYKTNNTKIPLLSPLRSLPNGVHDEIVLDRERNKAQIIQRVGNILFNGRQNLNGISHKKDGFLIFNYSGTSVKQVRNLMVSVSCDRLRVGHLTDTWNGMFEAVSQASNGNYLQFSILKDKLTTYDIDGIKKYFSENPTVVYYELATPIISEVDLEGFPYIYKDGHIFLNGEIAPVTEIKYSINQQHQIEASNQDIIRHQKEIDYLYKLIGEYVRVDYKNTLLSLNLELK